MSTAIITSFLQLGDNNLNPLSGGTVTVQDAGTTTPRAIFTDTGLSVAATNPIPLDSAGRHTQGIVYTATGSYKIIIKDSGGSTLFTRDNIDGGVPVGSGALAIANGGTSATTAEAALAALGAATAAELAELSAEVAALAGAAESTEATHIATGTTAQRPSAPAEGDLRRNTDTTRWEGYVAAWQNFMTDNDVASQAQQEAASSVAVFTSPGRQHFHPGHPKFMAFATVSGGVPTLVTSYNVTSVTDTGLGLLTVTIGTDFSSANWAALVTVTSAAGVARTSSVSSSNAQTAGTVCAVSNDSAGGAADPGAWHVSGLGDQA